jgi:Fur family transcriptional regulator, peroxide stress response regulator
MVDKSVVRLLVKNRLKVTPQRVAILEVINSLENHPTADDIINYLRLSYPSLSLSTIYKNLETFVKKGILKRLETGNEILRYDSVPENHHHLYSTESDEVKDFFNEDLNRILNNYFRENKIPNFVIKDFKLQITGKFTETAKSKKRKSD